MNFTPALRRRSFWAGGTHMIEYIAVMAAWVGEKEFAREYLEQATRLCVLGIQT